LGLPTQAKCEKQNANGCYEFAHGLEFLMKNENQSYEILFFLDKEQAKTPRCEFF